MNATVRILRFDPSVDVEPYYKDCGPSGVVTMTIGAFPWRLKPS